MSYGFKSFQDEIELGEGKNGCWKTQRKWLKMKSKYQTFANGMHVDAVYNKLLEPKPDAISPIELFVINEIENINEKKSIIFYAQITILKVYSYRKSIFALTFIRSS